MYLHQRIRSSDEPSNIVNPASNSSTWTSGGASERTRLQRLHNIGNHIGVTASPFYPKSVQEYNLHNTLYKEDTTAFEKKKLENRLAVLDAISQQLGDMGLKGRARERERMKLRVGKFMGGMDFENGRDMTTVLAKTSIWAPLGAKEEENSVDDGWPNREELKWEGEGHVRQGLARRFPLAKEEKLRATNRESMIRAGEGDEVAKMERGERAMPFRMKEVKRVQAFDETTMGKCDRAVMGLQKWQPASLERVEEFTDEEAREKGLLGKDLFDEL